MSSRDVVNRGGIEGGFGGVDGEKAFSAAVVAGALWRARRRQHTYRHQRRDQTLRLQHSPWAYWHFLDRPTLDDDTMHYMFTCHSPSAFSISFASDAGSSVSAKPFYLASGVTRNFVVLHGFASSSPARLSSDAQRAGCVVAVDINLREHQEVHAVIQSQARDFSRVARFLLAKLIATDARPSS